MNFKILTVLSVFILSCGNVAAEEIINDDVRRAMEETDRAMQESALQMQQTMQKVMPEVADSFSQVMNDLLQAFPPLISAIEQNRVLSKAADRMQQEMQQSLQQLNTELDTLPIPAEQDEFTFSGSRNNNGRTLDFTFSKDGNDLKTTANALTALEEKENGKELSDRQLTDLSGRQIPLSQFKLETINGTDFLVYEHGDDDIYLTGNNRYGLNARVQAKGENAGARARLFLQNFKQQQQ